MKVQCPYCHKTLIIPETHEGKKVRCAYCKEVIIAIDFKPGKTVVPLDIISKDKSNQKPKIGFLFKLWDGIPKPFKITFFGTLGVISALILCLYAYSYLFTFSQSPNTQIISQLSKDDDIREAQNNFVFNAIDILGCFGKGQIDDAADSVKRLNEKNPHLQYIEIMELFRTYKEARISMPTIPRTEMVVGMGIKAINSEERKKLIEWVGHLDDLYQEKKEVDDLFDIAFVFRRDFGNRTDDVAMAFKGLNILMAQGVSADDALATLYSAYSVEQGGEALIGLAGFMAELKSLDAKTDN